MHFNSHEKTAVLIDGANLWKTAQAINLDINWGRLQHFIQRQTMLAGCIYFTKLPAEHEDGYQPLRPLLDWLSFNGWQVFIRERDAGPDLAVTAMELAGNIDHFIIGTGDDDFTMLVEALQRKGCRVTILSTLTGGAVSELLRRTANDFLDLESIRAEIQREPRKEAVRA